MTPRRSARWFRQGGEGSSLERYLEAFQHTVGVMQTPAAIERVAAECALDLAADGVVYAEVRYAPELSTQAGLDLDTVMAAWLQGFQRGRGGSGRRRASPSPSGPS